MLLQAVPVGLLFRNVYYQVPLGPPPVNGWSVVILFQGSLFSPAVTMQAASAEPFGAYYQVSLVKRLLDAGYVVLEPEAHVGGSTFWDTNVPPWDVSWTGAPDDLFMQSILAELESGLFGPIDPTHRYATGISSGGYMTSRMAVSYAGKFRALAIASGSYATCSGPLCSVPSPLPADHPPTLFLHGDADPVVPLWTMEKYRDQLQAEGHVVKSIIEAGAGHQWIAAAPEAVLEWFNVWH
jgi:dienelactone hydrolase